MNRVLDFLFYTILTSLLILGCWSLFAEAKGTEKSVRLTIQNPYSISIGLELKCDWDQNVKRWKHWDYVVLKKYKKVTFKLLPGSKCEIWPKELR